MCPRVRKTKLCPRKYNKTKVRLTSSSTCPCPSERSPISTKIGNEDLSIDNETHAETQMFNTNPVTKIIQPKRVRQQMKSRYTEFKESLYFIPVLLITTFLLFMVIPDLTYIFVGVVSDKRSPELLAACFVSYAISALTDAWIYIYLQHDVRNLLKTKMKWLKF